MSVRENDRKTGELAVITKARALCIHTLKITQNERNFPKRYRFSVVEKLQRMALDIMTDLEEANEMYPHSQEERQHRLYLQQKAMGECRSLNVLIDISKEVFQLSSSTVEYWSGMVTEVRKLAAGWHKKDNERFNNIKG